MVSRSRLLLAASLVLSFVVVTSVACSRGGGDAGTAEPPQPTGGQTAPIKAGVEPIGITQTATLTVDGHDRTYHLYVPTTLPSDQPVPLLVALHGGTGTGLQFEKNSQFDRLAEANGFLVVYPDGTGVGPTDALRTWNGGNCCGRAMTDDVDDVAFVSALIDEISATHHVDAARVFATGHSNGAIMSYRLACELSDKIVAIGIYAGSLGVDSCTPTNPVSLLHIHGEADQNIPIDGGVGPKGISQTDFAPPRDGVETMARVDGCPSDPTVTTDGDLTTSTWSPCNSGTEVRFVTIAGASHAWPDGVQGVVSEAVVGRAYQGYDASTEIWAFLVAHPRVG